MKSTLIKPMRVQRLRKKGFKLQNASRSGLPVKYVGRPTKWGNPFRVIQYSDKTWSIKTDGSDRCNDIMTSNCHAFYGSKEDAVKDAVKCYAKWIMPYSHNDINIDNFYISMANQQSLMDLKGKNLACWCKEDDLCHGDYLLYLINNVKDGSDSEV